MMNCKKCVAYLRNAEAIVQLKLPEWYTPLMAVVTEKMWT